jgi:hypothetical protein
VLTKIVFLSATDKVLLIGDSHLRGCAVNMEVFLNARFEVCGFIKPGAVSKIVMESAKRDTEKLTMDDLLIMCSGANDIGRSGYREVFNNVISFLNSVTHTNIVVLSIPYRYDIKYPYINNEIRSFNRKLLKFTKVFPHVSVLEIDNNRLLFTKHGLHLNGLGEELLSNQLALHIDSALKKVTVHSITLAWNDSQLQVNAPSTASSASPVSMYNSQEATTNRTPKRTRKTPVMRNDDFLWGI